MTGLLLQVRLDSTRLPGKALLDISGKSLIEHAMISLKKINCDIHVIVTTKDSYFELKPYADKYQYEIFAGSKNDVLKRYVDTIKFYNIDRVIRATGDNPLVSHELANMLLAFHKKNGFDYSGFLNNPIGTGVEIVNSNSLIEADILTTSDYDREHVTPFLYNNKEKYKVFQGNAPEAYLLPNTYVTIDTKEDYQRIVKLFHELYHGNIITIESVVKWLKKEQSSSTQI